jgi:AcrR family transcriptional regulator
MAPREVERHSQMRSKCYDLQMPVVESVDQTRRKRLKSADRKAQIVAAAREVFIEQGINGARSKEIAERAGITEAYLYRHFHSKGEIFRVAIDAPLKELIEHLRQETHELAERDDVTRAEVLLHCHELFLDFMVEMAPLIAAALFSDPDPRHEFYTDYLFPNLRGVLEVIIPEITGRSVKEFEVDVFVEAMIGIHLTVSLESLLDGKSVDVPHVARQITEMFAPGVGRRPAGKRPAAVAARASAVPKKRSAATREPKKAQSRPKTR